jgi:hypothetical protein
MLKLGEQPRSNNGTPCNMCDPEDSSYEQHHHLTAIQAGPPVNRAARRPGRHADLRWRSAPAGGGVVADPAGSPYRATGHDDHGNQRPKISHLLQAREVCEDGQVEIMKARLLAIIIPTGHLSSASSDAVSLHQTRWAWRIAHREDDLQ